MIREFFRNGRVVEGENEVFQKKDVGRGQNVVDEVRGAEKRLVGKIGRLFEMFQRSKCSKSENDNDGNSARGSVCHLRWLCCLLTFVCHGYRVAKNDAVDMVAKLPKIIYTHFMIHLDGGSGDGRAGKADRTGKRSNS